jgi:dehydrogenase/reductase SDR family protein 12
MGGKVVVVTGANSGNGKALATYAAAKGAKLYMICRSEGRAMTARDEIAKETDNDDIKIILVSVC